MDAVSPKRYEIILIYGIFIAFLFYPFAANLVYLGKEYSITTIFISRLLIWLELIILFFYAHRVEKNNFFLWAEKSYRFWFYPASFGALYLLAIGAGTVSLIPRLFGLHDDQYIMTRMLTIVSASTPMVLFTCITAGITEELICRAYLVPRLELLFKNKYMPVIMSALIFALLHYRYFSVREILFTFLFGVVFAIHYQWYRNIKILIATHAIMDLMSFLFFHIVQVYHLQPHS